MTARLGRLEPPNFSFSLIQTAALTRLTRTASHPAKLTLIAAPTGYGKTVLQTALFRHFQARGTPTHWVSLDERDQTVDVVLTLLERSLLEAIDPLEPSPAMHQSDDPPDERIDRLVDHLSQRSGPSVLLIDNISYCDDDTLRPLLDALVFKTPDRLSLILAGTREPPVNLSRAKMEGKVSLVGYADLAMGEAEVSELFGPALCQRLGDAAVRQVTRQTEGWPAAIRLMQIILESAPQPLETLQAFTGADEDLAGMLNHQVLQEFDAAGRQFLLEIAGLRSFCVPLVQHATGNAQAADYVARILRQNLFIIPLDRNRTWYRLHGLFREFLIGEAERSLTADRRHAVLLRAAEWCEQGGYWSDAVEYGLAAQDFVHTAAMLERVAPQFVRDRGDLRRYIGWIERHYHAQAEIGWEAEFWYVWALVFHRRYETARRHVERLVDRVEQAGPAEDHPAHHDLLRRIEIIRIAIATYTDHLREAQARGKTWLTSKGADDPFDVATVACAIGASNCAHFDFASARESFRIAHSNIAQSDSAYGVAWVTALSTTVSLHEGDFAQALTVYDAALTRARKALGDNAGMTSTLALLMAKCAVETGDEAAARDALELGMRRAQNHGLADTAAAGLDAAVKLWASPLGGTISLSTLREVAASYPPRLGLMLSCLIVQRMLRLGRMDDALLEAVQVGLGSQPAKPPPAALMEYPIGRSLYLQTVIELDIAAGRLRQAEQQISEETRLAKAEGRWGALVELALAEMSVSLCTQNPAPAARHLTRAVSYAAKRGHRRPFRDRAEQIAGLVNETKPQSWGFVRDEERSFFSEVCRHLPIANSALVEQLERLDVQATLLETPTARELELLALIEAGLSNQQLADRLSVSVATVKWHLYNLYTKLGVSSRSAALAKGRALGLLSR